MRKFMWALAAAAVLAAGCQEKPIDPLKPKVGLQATETVSM